MPLHNGENATMSGVCLEKITPTFPCYPLQGKVEQDLIQAFKETKKRISKQLPKLPKFVGGDTDFMIGIRYLRYYPEKIFELPTGLTIYESKFKNIDGTRGIVGGPHPVFKEIEKRFYGSVQQQKTYLSQQYSLFNMRYQVNPDISLLSIRENKDHLKDIILNDESEYESNTNYFSLKQQNIFNLVENAATEISCRCISCRDCKDCLNNEHIENISIREEVEQDLIDKSVQVNTGNRCTTAKLPFIHNPMVKLSNNKNIALKIYNQQLRKLNKNLQDKADVITSENKLQRLGHVDYVQNLSHEQRMLSEVEMKYYFPWRAVWKQNSISTPCRVVFDVSQITNTGYSLNDVIAKGRNNMNKLVEIVLRWMTHLVAFHTDIQKTYNSIKLRQEDWCYQRYIWQQDLDPSKIPNEKVIKSLIYGVRSSANQAETGLRKTADISKNENPEVCEIIHKDIYVDDCLSGSSTETLAFKLSDELQIVVNIGGFSLKGFTFSGYSPYKSLSSDGESEGVAGLRWYPEDDKVALDISELNFSRKYRGRKLSNKINTIPSKLTRRHCVSKVSEMYDLTGLITPITAGMKIDLHTLVQRNLNWDDAIPDDLRPLWETHFQMMQEIKNIKFNRAIIPKDAISLNINTVDTGDASKNIACVANYARCERPNGEFSCQLIFSRSKLVPDSMSNHELSCLQQF